MFIDHRIVATYSRRLDKSEIELRDVVIRVRNYMGMKECQRHMNILEGKSQ
jgi:hypothetical protein